MEGYNIFYKNNKINNRFLSKKEVDKIKSYSSIYKKQKFGDDTIEIPVKDLKIIKYTIVV